MRWLRSVFMVGLVLGISGVILILGYSHHHQVCFAPYGAAITALRPAPSRGDCSLVNSLYYLGIGLACMGALLLIGAGVRKLWVGRDAYSPGKVPAH